MLADSGDDPEIVYNGYRRVDLDKSAGHKAKLEEDGLVFCGFSQNRQEKERQRTSSTRPTPEDTIDLVSDSDDEDDQHEPIAARTSKSISVTASSAALGVPRSGSSTRHGGARVSVKVCAVAPSRQSSCDHTRTPDTRGFPKARSWRTQTGYQSTSDTALSRQYEITRGIGQPSSPSALAKRAVPGEFTLPKTAKRQKKDKQNQSPKPTPNPISKRILKRKYNAETLSREIAGPNEPETIVISSDEEPVPKVRSLRLLQRCR